MPSALIIFNEGGGLAWRRSPAAEEGMKPMPLGKGNAVDEAGETCMGGGGVGTNGGEIHGLS